jgi:Ca2+/Na+ antiporter
MCSYICAPQGISSFYISFLFSPFIANIPEIITCHRQSSKKTHASIATCFATLQGSVCMNNTLALGKHTVVRSIRAMRGCILYKEHLLFYLLFYFSCYFLVGLLATVGIFMLLIYTQELTWQYTAETCTILLVEVIAGCLTVRKRYFSVLDGLLLMLLYPCSFLLVICLKRRGWK